MIFHFNISKTIQASAVLLKTDPSKRMSRLRLLKLLYIADREALTERAREITGDHAVAMDYGPVLSTTYDLIKGEDFLSTQWEKFVLSEGLNVILTADPGVGDLSRYEIAKLHEVAERFRDQNDWQIAEYTHDFEEWKKHKPAKGSCKPIPVDDLLAAVGLSHLKDRLEADASAEAVVNKLLD